MYTVKYPDSQTDGQFDQVIYEQAARAMNTLFECVKQRKVEELLQSMKDEEAYGTNTGISKS